ncbi:MAG: glycosyltransferase family 2 protein [Acidimicrobiales bacterium]|jgi:glycosyltransferase involved in cell wall biosynthesis
MNVSVVICAYTMDRWDDLVAAVRSCADQRLKPHEIVVVIDYNDELVTRAQLELTDARVVANRSTRGLSGARNSGVVVSTGDVIAFLDDDAFAESDWLEHLVAPLQDPHVAGTGGWIVPNWDGDIARWLPETFYWVIGCSYLGLPADRSTIRNPIGASMALRRSVFSSVGGFTSGIGRVGLIPLGCEETELCIRYISLHPSERFELARNAIVHHRVPRSRLTWHYFWTRCWAEGLSKAAVTSLAGAGSGLSSERHYVVHALPQEFLRSARSLRKEPRANGTRIALLIAGSVITVAGLLRGRIALRRTPLSVGVGDLDAFMTGHAEEEG